MHDSLVLNYIFSQWDFDQFSQLLLVIKDSEEAM